MDYYNKYFEFMNQKVSKDNEETLYDNGDNKKDAPLNSEKKSECPSAHSEAESNETKEKNFDVLKILIKEDPSTENISDFMSFCFKDYLAKHNMQMHDIYN